MVKICIVGTGYVGLVTGVGLSDAGHKVICSDVSIEKIQMLNKGIMPIFEIGLEELVKKNVSEGRLTFTTDVSKSITESEVVISSVGTPMGENHEADLKYVKEVAKIFAQNLNSYKIFVNKSTVPVGTGRMVKEIIKSITDKEFDVVSNPEFLKEGAAINDFMNPDRIVIGTESEKAKKIMENIYKPFARVQSPIFHTSSIESAELIKYAANSMLATRISFMNEIAKYCEKVGADIKEVAKGIGLDNRIGPKFLQAGVGYGGSCFPKDVVALIESGKQVGIDFKILNSVEEVNNTQKTIIAKKIKDKIGNLSGKKIGIWGLAFKPKTDDVRKAPAAEIIKYLIDEGAQIIAFDPIAEKNFQKEYSNLKIIYSSKNYEATKDVDVLLVVTEWNEFRELDFKLLKENMKGNLIVDGRNIYNPNEIRENGFEYIGVGRN